MALAHNKSKLVCMIGPASECSDILRKMLQAGINIARLNFSHGVFSWHKTVIENLLRVAHEAAKRVTMLALDVHTEGELEDVLAKAAIADSLVFIEIHTGRMDCPESLRSAGRSMAKTNQLD